MAILLWLGIRIEILVCHATTLFIYQLRARLIVVCCTNRGPYVPTNETIIREMLKLANVTNKDILYDVGCGDGRTPPPPPIITKASLLNIFLFFTGTCIEAAKRYGATCVGLELDDKLFKEAMLNVEKAKLAHKVSILRENALKVDYRFTSSIMTQQKSLAFLSLSLSLTHTHTHTHTC